MTPDELIKEFEEKTGRRVYLWSPPTDGYSFLSKEDMEAFREAARNNPDPFSPGILSDKWSRQE